MDKRETNSDQEMEKRKEPVKSFVGMFRKMKIPCMIIEGLQYGFGELYW